MIFGLSTYFVTKHALDRVIDEIIASGFNAVELSYEPPHLFSFNSRLIDKITSLRANGIQFSMHGPFLETNLGSYLDEISALSTRRILDAIELTSKLGANPMVVHPGYSFFRKLQEFDAGLRERFLKSLRVITGEAHSRGVQLALENVFMSYFYFQELEEFAAIREAVPGIGVTLDIGHAYISRQAAKDPDPEGAILDSIRAMGIENLFHVHLHNNNGIQDDHDFLSGSIDMSRILRGLADLGYKQKVIIETLDAEKHGFAPVVEKLNSIKP